MTAETTNGQGIAAKAIEVKQLMAGKPYVWGGKTINGFDCSGFVSYVLNQQFPNMSPAFSMGAASFMSSNLFEDVNETDIQAGDIILFPATNSAPAHVGIVLDGSSWVGSQSSTGVKDVLMSNPWWGARTRKFRRLRSISTSAMNSGRDYYGIRGLA